MEETKICPHCGESLSINAKKCTHCRKWLEKQCPVCNEWIDVKAKKCKHCGTWLNKFTKEEFEGSGTENTTTHQSVSIRDIEDAIDDKKEQDNAGCLMWGEVIVIAILLGLFYDWIWWEYVIAIVVATIIFNIRVLRVMYCIAISAVWAFIGFALTPVLFEESEFEQFERMAMDDYGDYWWVAGIAFIISLVFHWPAMKSRFNA